MKKEFICVYCGEKAVREQGARHCWPCQKQREPHMWTAILAVRKAVRQGGLPKLDGSIACVDCGAPARDYDHRDYSRPLDVDPVCRACNQARGPAAFPMERAA